MKITTYDGLLVIDKPTGMTSRAVVDHVLTWFPVETRIGHTGTLDPLATGLLVLCIGSATRLAEYVQRMKKTYRATFILGAVSDTDDADGKTTARPHATAPEMGQVSDALRSFQGIIQQTPPDYSAARTEGQRAYRMARNGRTVKLSARPVQIESIEILSYAYPRLELNIYCGKGTYIRSLARDVGEILGCGAYVQELRRTRVGPFTCDRALRIDSSAETALSQILPSSEALSELPRITLSNDDSHRLADGQRIPTNVLLENEASVYDESGTLIGIVKSDGEGRLVAVRIFRRYAS